MLGPVSGVASAARRRSRRRRRLVISAVLLLVFVVAELVHQVVNASAPAARRTAGSWVAAMAPTINDANLLTPTLGYLESSGSRLSRPQLALIMQGLDTAASRQESDVRTSTFGAPSVVAKNLLVTALDLRARSLANFNAAVETVISGGSVAGADAGFATSASLMQSAQLHYRLFIRALPKGSAPTQLPAVDWSSPDGAFVTSKLNQFASALAHAPQLRARHALVITTISLNPLPEVIPTTTTMTTTTTTIPRRTKSTSTKKSTTTKRKSPTTTTTTTLPRISQIPPSNSPSVFAPTPSVRPIIVVKNEGNVAEMNVTVEVVMNNEIVSSVPLARLAPGDSRFLELSALKVVTSTMAKCSSPALRHDRCTQMEVIVKTPTAQMTHRSVALAFFVS